MVIGAEDVVRDSSVSLEMPSQESGWFMYHDEEGRPYYYRERDGKCQYEFPDDAT